ncbi:MAG: hypothetical protein H7Z38_21995 [Rubrivivax sp.]|nr:hypothetical protein [Pyrinomonadaceae bacterium]
MKRAAVLVQPLFERRSGGSRVHVLVEAHDIAVAHCEDVRPLPLKKGRNELTLAVSELGGGWGFVCRLADVEN